MRVDLCFGPSKGTVRAGWTRWVTDWGRRRDVDTGFYYGEVEPGSRPVPGPKVPIESGLSLLDPRTGRVRHHERFQSQPQPLPRVGTDLSGSADTHPGTSGDVRTSRTPNLPVARSLELEHKLLPPFRVVKAEGLGSLRGSS